MSLQSREPRTLVAHARAEAFAPRTRSILGNLGYRIVMLEELEELLGGAEAPRPDLRIVDERRLSEVPEDDGAGPVPMIVLTGRHGVTGADSRIVGALMRPAGLHDLYCLLQQVFEQHPRSAPRVPTHLRAVCRRRGEEWSGAVLSLSENGCLLRSTEPLTLGTRLELCFELPRVGPIELWAETAYQLVPDMGLVFSALAPAHREAIVSYVDDALGASPAATL
ncbi:MAG: PilZ domain-containing protein [Proteobacteria bacterium]|nr:PilZ domain-containing protein [Pseudomonadota bacterium]